MIEALLPVAGILVVWYLLIVVASGILEWENVMLGLQQLFRGHLQPKKSRGWLLWNDGERQHALLDPGRDVCNHAVLDGRYTVDASPIEHRNGSYPFDRPNASNSPK